ncbi:MAG: hypothetical protein WCK16_04670 [Candidatus Moraniibacteriota bacterium]
MEKKINAGKMYLIIVGIITVGSILATYIRIIVQKNYTIESQVDCDPYVHNCFVWRCDPESIVEGEGCTGDSKIDTQYYNLVKRIATNIPRCDPDKDENCLPMLCGKSEKKCESIFCVENDPLGECSNPIEYAKNNPPEEVEQE